MRSLKRAGAVVIALAAAGWPLGVGSPADAAATVGGPAAAVAPCLLVDSGRHAPHWRQYEDTTRVTEADLEAIPQAETRRAFVAREVTPQLATTEIVPVYVHVIKGKHRGERVTAGPRKISRMLSILNNAFAGNQNALSTATRYRFQLRATDYTRRDGWYHAFLNGPRDTRMKRALHRGDAGSLNLYINGGGPRDFPVLGWARFPWQYAARPRLDHVSVNKAALPGGRAAGYNLGDTTVHEVGHWLGLFHTFEGGCETGDQVPDTPAEAEPSYYCETTRDTCLEDAGTDPVTNFMDYSLDSCMSMFSAGQVRRMDAAFEKWRQ